MQWHTMATITPIKEGHMFGSSAGYIVWIFCILVLVFAVQDHRGR